MHKKNENLTWVKNIYWRLDEISCVLVLRNKEWFQAAITEIGDVWDIIEKERVEGYEHRAPKKNNRKSKAKKQETKTGLSCKIPRKQEAIEAIYCLIWRKGKRNVPLWITEDLY